jgi:hypothetical protein
MGLMSIHSSHVMCHSPFQQIQLSQGREGRVKYVFLGLRRQLCCQAEGRTYLMDQSGPAKFECKWTKSDISLDLTDFHRWSDGPDILVDVRQCKLQWSNRARGFVGLSVCKVHISATRWRIYTKTAVACLKRRATARSLYYFHCKCLTLAIISGLGWQRWHFWNIAMMVLGIDISILGLKRALTSLNVYQIASHLVE